MAISKILHMKEAKTGNMAKHLANTITYITDPLKTDKGRYVCGYNCLPEAALAQMIETKKRNNKMGKRQGYHIVISFEKGEVDADTAFEIVGKFVKEYLGKSFEAVYSVHNDTNCMHGHVVFNSVRCTDGLKYSYKKGDWKKYIQPIVNHLCTEYGLSTINLDDPSENKENKEWNQGRQGKFAWGDMVRRDLDASVTESADFQDFIYRLKVRGYEIKFGKHMAVKLPDMERFQKLYTLGEDYTEEILRVRLLNYPIPKRHFYANKNPTPRIIDCGIRQFQIPDMTRYRKLYIVRMCRISRLNKKPYHEAWRYKDEVARLKSSMEELQFLYRNNVKHAEDLERVVLEQKENGAHLQQKRKELYNDRRAFSMVITIAEKLEELQEAVLLYEHGETEFQTEYLKRVDLTVKLEEIGYTYIEAIGCRDEFAWKRKELAANQRLLKKDRLISKRLVQQAGELQERRKNISASLGREEIIRNEMI